jgi:cobalt-precorrin-5B (C1)-methyltransferase
MSSLPSRFGYTLPVFACAAAIAALRWLRQPQLLTAVTVDLIEPAETAEISIEQVAGLKAGAALAMTRSDPGDNLDLTRHTPIWALVEWGTTEQTEPIVLQGGEGVGRQIAAGGQAAIYTYAQQLLHKNLERWLEPGEKIQVTLILPEGRSLAKRTSNEAFGVVEGLSLLGTTGISQPLSAPGQLEHFRSELRQKATGSGCLVFCVGENGLDLGGKLGIDVNQLVKTANWIGPMLVEAGLQEVKSVLLLGYHGKLIKLAGGIFHTHHHVADGRQEILAAHCANLGLPLPILQEIFSSSTTEAALNQLRDLDKATGSQWVDKVYSAITQQIDQRSQAYIFNHSNNHVTVGSALFDRSRVIIAMSPTGSTLMQQVLRV